jgi:hypothetical protein
MPGVHVVLACRPPRTHDINQLLVVDMHCICYSPSVLFVLLKNFV